jgi:hypothetical protein
MSINKYKYKVIHFGCGGIAYYTDNSKIDYGRKCDSCGDNECEWEAYSISENDYYISPFEKMLGWSVALLFLGVAVQAIRTCI